MIGLAGVVAGAAAVFSGYVAAFFPPPVAGAAPWLAVAGLSLLLPGFLLLGWAEARVRTVALAGLFSVLLLLGLGGALLLPPEAAGDRLVLGLPRRAALLLYGLGLLPALLVPLLYAVTFDRLVLSRERLAELERQLEQENPAE